jgi:6-phosphogluconolactonase/glucosamine-6-phosphate isomerase/deaminase
MNISGSTFNSVTMGDHNHMDWNHIGGVHGDERYVTDADLGEEYHDESHIRVDFNVEVPADDASEAELAAWDALNPQTASIDWAS